MRSYGNGTLKGAFRKDVSLDVRKNKLKHLGETWKDMQSKGVAQMEAYLRNTYKHRELFSEVQVKHGDDWHVIWRGAPEADANGLTKAFQTGADTHAMSVVLDLLAAVLFFIFGHICWKQQSVLLHGSSHAFYSLDVTSFPPIIDRLSELIDAEAVRPLDADDPDSEQRWCHRCHTELALVIASAQDEQLKTRYYCAACAPAAHVLRPFVGHLPALAMVRNQLRFLSRAGDWCNIPQGVGPPVACLTTLPPHTVRIAVPRLDPASLRSELDERTPTPDPHRANFKKAVAGGAYQQFQLSTLLPGRSTLGDVAAAMRARFPEMPLASASANDAADRDARRTLVLVGDTGHGTGLHADFAGAVNVALAFDGSLEPLTLWLFVRPDEASVGAVSDRLRASLPAEYPDGLFCAQGGGAVAAPHPVMSLPEMRTLAAACPAHVTLVEQCHGDAVVVPVGWIHCVVNARACVKVAYNRLVPGDLANIALCQRLVCSRVLGRRMVQDHVAMFSKLVCELQHTAAV